MPRDPNMRKILLTIRSVLDDAKPAIRSPNFDALADLVKLGLWEPKRAKPVDRTNVGRVGAEVIRPDWDISETSIRVGHLH
jgi:hypothetical protein